MYAVVEPAYSSETAKDRQEMVVKLRHQKIGGISPFISPILLMFRLWKRSVVSVSQVAAL